MEEKEILFNSETLKGKSPTGDHIVKMTYDYWLGVLNTITNLSTRVANLEKTIAKSTAKPSEKKEETNEKN